MNIRQSLGAVAVLAGMMGLGSERVWPAESTITVLTNFYSVTGSNLFELRTAMAQARPWKTNLHFDAFTRWSVRWQFQSVVQDGQFRVDAFATQTKAVVTLPRWLPPEGVPPEVVKPWAQFLKGLMTHEEGHVRLAREAAAAIRREVAALGSYASRQELTDAINNTANRVLDRYRRQERDYDLQTRHGVLQGARFR